MKDFYSPKEVAKILNVHEKTVRRYLRDGVLRGQKLGGSWKVSKDILMSYMDDKPQINTGNFEMDLEETVRLSLKIEIDVKNSKEGHKLAQSLMDLIKKHDYISCDFQYNYSRKVASYHLSGSHDFLVGALELIKNSGYRS